MIYSALACCWRAMKGWRTTCYVRDGGRIELDDWWLWLSTLSAGRTWLVLYSAVSTGMVTGHDIAHVGGLAGVTHDGR